MRNNQANVLKEPSPWTIIRKVLITLMPIIVGLLITLKWEQLIDSTKIFFYGFLHLRDFPPNYYTILVWVLFLTWLFLIVYSIISEDSNINSKFFYIIRNMHLVPSLGVLRDYPEQVETITNIMNSVRIPEKIEEHKISELLNEISEAVNASLQIVCDLTAGFAESNKAVVSANIMGLYDPDNYLKMSPLINHQLLFTGEQCVESYKSVLVTLPNLNANNREDISNTPLVALPVSYWTDNDKVRTLLPGAPSAIYKGNTVSTNTLTIKDECENFSSRVKIEVENYFEKNKKEIRSFACLRLMDEFNAIGVLNIHSDKEDIIGADNNYILTFLALISPVVNILEPYIKKYVFLYEYHLYFINLQKQRQSND